MSKWLFEQGSETVLIERQSPSQQPGSYHGPLSPPWYSPLPPHGQIPARHATRHAQRARCAVLEVCSHSLLLQLVCRHHSLWRWLVWIYLLRYDTLLSPPS